MQKVCLKVLNLLINTSDIIMKILIIIFIVATFSVSAFARSGCCSHHGGVCGCSCCDGQSLSATCAPYYPSCSSKYESTSKENEDNNFIKWVGLIVLGGFGGWSLKGRK